MDGVIGLLDAIPYLRAYADHTFVVKAGGDLLAKVAWRRSVAREVAVLHRLGIRIVFVHGGGPQLDAISRMQGWLWSASRDGGSPPLMC